MAFIFGARAANGGGLGTALLLTAAITTACGRHRNASVTDSRGDSAPAVDAGDASASPPRAGSAPRAPGAPRFALPETPPGADPEQVKIAASICPAMYMRDAGAKPPRVVVGCRKPPPYDHAGAWPDGKLVQHTGERHEVCGIEKVYRGSFSRSGAKEAVVALDNCFFDSGANAPGRAVLVEERDGAYRYVTVEPDVDADRCTPSTMADGRDVLLCEGGQYGPGVGTMTLFFVLDLGRRERRTKLLAAFVDNASDVPCYEHVSGRTIFPEGIGAIDISKRAAIDVNGDGRNDLVVLVERRRAPAGAPLEASARAACKGQTGVANGALVAKHLSAKKRTEITLVSDSLGFSATAESRRALDAWAAELPTLTRLHRETVPAARME